MENAGIAVIGYGGMGGWHTNTIRRIEGLKLLGIYDIKEERRVAAEANGIHAYSTFDELLNDKDIRIVTVATPNDTHKDICIKAMEHGKNVVCEKPVALSSTELDEMIDAAWKNNVLFTVHQNRRWDHDFLTMKKIFDEGTLGRVFNVESRVHGSRGIPGDWRNQKVHGGGMVLDWGVHLLDQILMLAGKRKITSVYATLDYVTNEECDDGLKVILTFDDGLKAHVEVGTSNFISLPRWYMTGENGSAVVYGWDISGEIIMVSDWEKRDAVPVVTAAGLTKTMAPRTDETIKKYPLPAVSGEIDEYYRNIRLAIDGKAAQIVTHPQMKRVVKLMETIMKAAETNSVIKETF